MFNTLAYYLGYGPTTEDNSKDSYYHQNAGGKFKINDLKEEDGWGLIEKSFQEGLQLVGSKLHGCIRKPVNLA